MRFFRLDSQNAALLRTYNIRYILSITHLDVDDVPGSITRRLHLNVPDVSNYDLKQYFSESDAFIGMQNTQ